MKRLREGDHFRRILVIVTRQIGDVLLTTPLIRAVRQRWPDARIDVLGFAGTLAILAGNPDIAELINVPPGSGWRQSWPLIRALWREYDLAVISQYSDRAHLYGLVAAGVRSGQVSEGREGRFKRWLLRHAVTLTDAQGHAVAEKLRLVSPWADDVSSKVIPPALRPMPMSVADRLEPRYAVFHVPSRVRYKQYPLGHSAQVIEGLVQQGFQVVLTGGASDTDRGMVADVVGLAGNPAGVIDTCGQLDFGQLATLLTGAAVFIGPDTSITHLATACGAPVVALYGPIDPNLWGPVPVDGLPSPPYERSGVRQRRGNVILLQGTQPCVPCNGAGCDKHDNSASQCLETMSPDRVLHAVAELAGVHEMAMLQHA
jgi:heptosyltransferase-3